MARRSSYFLPLLLFQLQGISQEPPAGLPRFAPKQLQEDLRILRSALEEGHSGIYRYTKKTDLDRIFDSAKRKLDHPMDALEFYRITAPTIAAIKCGHTQIAPPQDLQKSISASEPLFPFAVEVIGNKVYVFRDYSTSDGRLAGSELRLINGVSIDRILSLMTAATPGDGDISSSRAWHIGRGRGFQRMLYPLLGIRSPFRVTLRNPTGEQESSEIAGILQPKIQEIATARYPKDVRRDSSADLRFEDGGRIAVLTVYGFVGSAGDPQKPLGKYFPDVFREIHDKESKSLILDVRNNGGGFDELGKQLFSFLWGEPFRYYDDLVINALTFSFRQYMIEPQDIPAEAVELRGDGKYHNTKHANWGIQQPSRPHFGGKVFILINGGSFSTTSEFTSTTHFHKRATFIGEEAGGGYYGNTSGYGNPIMLPSTKTVVYIPFQTYYLAVSGYKHSERGVMPDYAIRDTIEDRLAGKDRAFEVALRLARE